MRRPAETQDNRWSCAINTTFVTADRIIIKVSRRPRSTGANQTLCEHKAEKAMIALGELIRTPAQRKVILLAH